MGRMARDNDLARDLKRAERRRRMTALALIAPLFLFLMVSFVLPIGDMLRRSVVDSELTEVWPRTAALTRAWVWDRKSDPTPDMFRALGEDIRESAQERTIAVAARRLNYALRNGRSLVMSTGRELRRESDDPADWRARLVEIDPAWDERATWIAIGQAAGPLTDFYLLTAVDLERNENDRIVRRPPERSLYRQVLGRTLLISVTVTVLALILGFPVAYLVANAPKRVAGLLLILVLLPFWTSLLVRSAAWIVLLQDQGLINGALQATGIISEPMRLIFNRTGVVVAMTHVLLPFMILPMIASMKAIPPIYMRAALSLGAHPAIAFVRVYLPLTLPGVAAGALLVFIMALGYYVTPALVGGAEDQMLAHFIAFYTTSSANWGLAAALGVLLLTATAILYLVYARLAGMGLVKVG